jgi:hypothetical protein
MLNAVATELASIVRCADKAQILALKAAMDNVSREHPHWLACALRNDSAFANLWDVVRAASIVETA